MDPSEQDTMSPAGRGQPAQPAVGAPMVKHTLHAAMPNASVKLAEPNRLLVEFKIEDLISRLLPDGAVLSHCGGCNGCTGCSM